MGVAHHLRERFGKGIAAHPLEPANSPTLRTGHKVGRHRIQGISDEFVPSIVKLGTLGRILDIWDGDAIVMSQRLANELGIAVGISSGANLLGALEIAHEQGRRRLRRHRVLRRQQEVSVHRPVQRRGDARSTTAAMTSSCSTSA